MRRFPLLASVGGGSNWTLVYRSPHTRLRALTTINSGNIRAAGDDGYLIHLQRKSASGVPQ